MEDKEARELATRAAYRAGKVALSRLGDAGDLRWKGHRDVVPAAALLVQETIVSMLQKESSGDSILAEEGPEDEPLDVSAERLWIVDPICGSLNFIQSIPFFAVSVALRVHGQLHVGAVYDPTRDEMFSASLTEGAYLNDRPIMVIAQAEGPEFWEQAWVGCDLPREGPMRREAMTAFQLVSKEVLHHLILGSPALGLCYVAAGRLHAYWTLDAKPWDVAAAGLILQKAGGQISDAEGGSWLHSDGGYVAANYASHRWAMRGIKWVKMHPEARALER